MKTISRLLVIAIWIGGTLAAQSIVQKTLPIDWSFSNNLVPRFNFRLLARDKDFTTVRWFDSNGTLLSQPQLSVPGISVLQVKDLASAPDGTIAVAARCSDQDGRTAFAIIWLQPGGNIIRVVKTDGFIPYHITFAPDGTLWAAGRGADSQLQEPATYDMLRTYDAAGQLLAGYLPRSAGPTSWVPAADSFLAAMDGRIGLYSVPDNQWIEVAANGQFLGKWTISGLPPASRVTGVAFGVAGGVYLSVFRGLQRGGTVGATAVTQIYHLLEKTGTVSPVDVNNAFPTPASTLVVGNDSNGIVVYSKNPARLTWLRLE